MKFKVYMLEFSSDIYVVYRLVLNNYLMYLWVSGEVECPSSMSLAERKLKMND